MNELLSMYYDFSEYIRRITNKDTIAKADSTLSVIEEKNPNLLTDAQKFIDCFTGNANEPINIIVLGADGHAIVSAIRKRLINTSVIWIPNLDMYEEYHNVRTNGIILSETAFEYYFLLNADLSKWTQYIVDNGFILFDLNGNIKRKQLLEKMNSNMLVPVKLFKNGILYSLNMPYKDSDEVNETPKSGYGSFKFKDVYCICPASIKTGGTELLHQLVYWINKLGGNANIAYVNAEQNGGYTPAEFSMYVAGHITSLEDIDDEDCNAIVIPEGWAYICADINNAEILFWWLSVDNFRNFCTEELTEEELFTFVKYKASKHLVQSEYSRRFITAKGISTDNIFTLSDYINDVYLEGFSNDLIHGKKDIVLYNPKKGKELVDELVRIAPDISWRPIEKMSTIQVRELMKKSKIYIDFGNHPGKDRIPREAAMSGCVVITGRKGSAAFYEDVSIPDRYKPNEEHTSYDDIIKLIKYCIKEYEHIINDFEEYRIKISNEKNQFIENIKKIFFL